MPGECAYRTLCFRLTLCLLCLPAWAQDDVHPYLTRKLHLHAGVYYPDQDMNIRVDGSLGIASDEFDFDQQLKLSDRDDVFALEGTWRITPKWSLRAQFFQEHRRNEAVLDEDIEWGDLIIGAGSRVHSGFDFKLTRIFMGRTFGTAAASDYGVGLGIHWLEIGTFIAQDVNLRLGVISDVSASGPLPNIGGWYYFSPSPKWLLGSRLDWLEVSLGDYAGGLLNFAAGANYQLFDNIGIGVNYQVFSLNAEVRSDSWRGRIEIVYDGWYAYISGNWGG